MTTFFKKHSTILLMSLLITLLILAWVFPSAGLKLGITFLLIIFCITSWIVLEKHKQAYRKGQISRLTFIRNAALEIVGTGLMMLLAGILGRYVAAIVAQPIDNWLLRVIAGIAVGAVVGIGVGLLAKKTLRRLVEIPH